LSRALRRASRPPTPARLLSIRLYTMFSSPNHFAAPRLPSHGIPPSRRRAFGGARAIIAA
jgi:hypothetical protein